MKWPAVVWLRALNEVAGGGVVWLRVLNEVAGGGVAQSAGSRMIQPGLCSHTVIPF